MKIVERLSLKRFALPLVWAAAFGGVVAWAACGRVVTTSTSSTGNSSTGHSTGSSMGGGSNTASAGAGCGGTGCLNASPSPGSACSTPGVCCNYILCDHMGGVNTQSLTCTNGKWQY